MHKLLIIRDLNFKTLMQRIELIPRLHRINSTNKSKIQKLILIIFF